MGVLDNLENIGAIEAAIHRQEPFNTPDDVEDMFIEAIALKRSGVIENELKEAEANEEASAEYIRYLLETGQIKDTQLTKKK